MAAIVLTAMLLNTVNRLPSRTRKYTSNHTNQIDQDIPWIWVVHLFSQVLVDIFQLLAIECVF